MYILLSCKIFEVLPRVKKSKSTSQISSSFRMLIFSIASHDHTPQKQNNTNQVHNFYDKAFVDIDAKSV